MGRLVEAEAALLAAEEVSSRNPDIAYALAALYAQQNHSEAARRYAEKLAEWAPGDPRARQLLESTRAGAPRP